MIRKKQKQKGSKLQLFNLSNPVAYANKITNETYTFREILKQEDASDFVSAMQKEIGDHKLNE
jgi:hypothetical protein